MIDENSPNVERESATSVPMTVLKMIEGLPFEGETGRGLLFRTNLGEIPAIIHRAPSSELAVIWVCGARGGFGGPASGMYARLAEQFLNKGITSLRLNYRQPNVLPECVLDLLAGIAMLKGTGHQPLVLVGHSFGGAVVIAAGVASSHVRGVVSLSPQTHGLAWRENCPPSRCWWCTVRATPACPTPVAWKSTTGRKNRNSWCFMRGPSIGWMNAGTSWRVCFWIGFQLP